MNFEIDYQKSLEQQKNKQEGKSLDSLQKELSDKGLVSPDAIKEWREKRQENKTNNRRKVTSKTSLIQEKHR